MFGKMKIWLVLLALGLFLAGCNLPSGESAGPPAAAAEATVTPPPEAVSTIVQATLQAFTATAVQQPLATPTALPVASLTPTPSPTATLTPTITPTYSPPRLTFTGNTNCRMGPGGDYPVVEVLQSGWTVSVTGRYQEHYWVVQAPDGKTCWAVDDFAQPEGSVFLVATVTPPPTPTPKPPVQPIGLHYYYVCQADGSVSVQLTWQDRATNEEGYRIYRDGNLIISLPANATEYDDALPYEGTYVYGIASFNVAGEAKTSMTADIACH